MKTGDIIPKNEQRSKVVNYILGKSPVENKIVVKGTDIKKHYDYDFIVDGLIVTIDYNLSPTPNKTHKVDEFWGDEIRIDIAAREDSTPMRKSTVREILKDAFDEYIEVINRNSRRYDQL